MLEVKRLGKLIFFGVGGIAYNEIKSIMDRNIEDIVFLAGGTSILRPCDFVQGLKEMNSLI